MTASEACQRRLRFLAERRSMREMEDMLTSYLSPRLKTLAEVDCQRLIALLGEADLDLWDWIQGNQPIPAQVDAVLLQEIILALTKHKGAGQ